jgi:hypothetical protein
MDVLERRHFAMAESTSAVTRWYRPHFDDHVKNWLHCPLAKPRSVCHCSIRDRCVTAARPLAKPRHGPRISANHSCTSVQRSLDMYDPLLDRSLGNLSPRYHKLQLVHCGHHIMHVHPKPCQRRGTHPTISCSRSPIDPSYPGNTHSSSQLSNIFFIISCRCPPPAPRRCCHQWQPQGQ